MRLVACIFLFSFGVSGALAQPAGPETRPASRVVEYHFEPEEVGGGRAGPDADVVLGDLRERFPSLIRVRVDFRDELLQTAESM